MCFGLSFSPNSFSYRGSDFKLVGEGSQILWIGCGGGGLSHRVSLEALCGMCTGVRVRRCKTGLSHRVSLEVLRGFADVRPGCHRVPLEVLCGMCRGQGSQM